MTVKLESSFIKNLNQNDISSYLKEINKFPLLSHEEEYTLADDWIKNKCLNAAHKLVPPSRWIAILGGWVDPSGVRVGAPARRPPPARRGGWRGLEPQGTPNHTF